MMIKIKARLYWAIIFLCLINVNIYAAQATVVKQKFGGVQAVILHGTYEEMGVQYGSALKAELNGALSIVKNFYMIKNSVTYDKLTNQAELFYRRFPVTYQRFIGGVSKGSGLSLEDVKILNAMETLGRLIPHRQLPMCAFLSVPPSKTKSKSQLIGRNYDFPPPYDQLSKYLTVTILNDGNTIPTAFVGLVGEIYCPTCINSNGLFMELNNGTPSGGRKIEEDRQSLLINML